MFLVKIKYLFFIILFLIGLSISSIALSLPQDKKELLHVAADSTIYNYKSGINVFEGNVKVDQGSTHITADKLTTKTNRQHDIQEMIAEGIKSPAHYWTTYEMGEPDIHAEANIIKFYPIDSNIILEKSVHMTQAENSFKGQMILYNSATKTITVPAAAKGRATLVYYPEKL